MTGSNKQVAHDKPHQPIRDPSWRGDTILTGQYSHRNGITTLNGSLPAKHQTLAHEMCKAGYETAVIGKWRYLKKYLRTARGVDDNIARLLAHLEESGDLDNTVIIYTSDQGFMLGEHDYIDKRWMYEESLRMPFLARHPETIKAGTVNNAMINNVDFAPTILDLAGVAAPDKMQGRSFRPILETGEAGADWPDATYYRYWMHMAHHDVPAHYGIRTRDFKLIFFYGLPLDAPGAQKQPTPAHWELYDLRNDPQEMNNVHGRPEYAATVKRLKAQLADLKQQVGDTDEKYPELLERLRDTQ